MIKKKKAAERYFGEAFRGKKTFMPKVETSLARIEQKHRMDRFGWNIFLLLLALVPLVAFIECWRVVS